MEIRVLGRLQVVSNTAEVTAVQRAKPASVLAVLVINARAQVGVDQLLHALWGETPPATAIKTLQTYIGQVRRLLGDERDRLVTSASGYCLDISELVTDAGRFERLVRHGQEQLPTAPAAAHRQFVEALALWRGTPYSDFAFADFARVEIARLEELRLTAQERRVEALLRLGRATEVVSDLQELTRRHPLREGLWAQLLRGLYASGRQAEALGAYTRVREILARELGVDPGPELQRLEQQILAQQLDIPEADDAPVSAPVAPEAPAEQRWITAVHLRADTGLLQCADRIASVVRRYEGSVLTVTDSAAVLVFGAPVAHDDDSERAVRCAQDLCSASFCGARLAAGVAAGEVRIDEELRGAWFREASAGPTVESFAEAGSAVFDAAADLAGGAQPGAVAVGGAVRRASRRTLRYDPAALEFRGTGNAAGPTTLVSQVPMIGRDTEMSLLDSLWELTRRAARPSLITLVGAPGIGKSRLVAEFVARLADRDVNVVTGSCRPYGDAVFGAVGEVVRDILAVTEDEPVREVRWKIEQWLQTFLPPDEHHRLTEYVVTLLSVLGDIADIRESTTWSLRRLFELAAAENPTVVVFENLHWAHRDLLTLIERTVAQTIGVPLMVIGVTRAELFDLRPTWGGGLSQHTALSLEPLAPAANRALAEALLARGDATTATLDAEAAGGNPLFVEELVAWELEGGHDSAVPATLRSVIDARLDALQDGARRTAIGAALVGDRFWPGAVAALGHIDADDLLGWLDHLEDRSVIVRRLSSTMRNEREYSFRHNLIAEVAYARVPADLRPAMHLAVGRWLEAQPDAPPAVLGHHWAEAGDSDRAVDYLFDAAEQANTGSQRLRAVALYQQALDVIGDDDPKRRRRITLRRAVALQAWAHVVLDVGHLHMSGHEVGVSRPDPGA
jgi:DNA-binding SARP family transcriptional activator